MESGVFSRFSSPSLLFEAFEIDYASSHSNGALFSQQEKDKPLDVTQPSTNKLRSSESLSSQSHQQRRTSRPVGETWSLPGNFSPFQSQAEWSNGNNSSELPSMTSARPIVQSLAIEQPSPPPSQAENPLGSTNNSPSKSTSTTSPPHGESYENLDFIQVTFDPASSGKRKATYQKINHKRQKCAIEAKENVRAVKQKGGPCLRCRILKKQCDDQDYCKTCPKQDIHAKEDHWKVLGCIRENLPDFCFHFMSRVLPRPALWTSWDNPFFTSTTSVDLWRLTLIKIELDSQPQLAGPFAVSMREFCTVCECKESWFNIDDAIAFIESSGGHWLHSRHIRYSWAGFYLQVQNREHLGQNYTTLPLNILSDRSTPISSHDPEYLCDSISFMQSQKGVERYVVYELTRSKNYTWNFKYVAELLSRSKMCWSKYGWIWWTGVFYHLIYCSINRSIIIDWYLSRSSHHYLEDVNKVNSLYKALVCAFVWASRTDFLIQDWKTETLNEDFRVFHVEELRMLERLVQRDKWEERGIKNSKDFLLRLGTGFYPDGVYKGFYVQKYGLEEQKRKFEASRKKR